MNKEKLTLIKLGGSVVTDKSKKYRFKEKTVKRLAGEIKSSGERLVLVHGAGSFGHPLAKRFKLDAGYSGKKQLEGLAKVQKDVRDLNLRIIKILIDSDIHAVSIPPNSIVRCRNKKIKNIDIDVFKEYLKLGLTPVTFGDVVLDEQLGFSICSGDQLMLALAKALKPKRAIFVVDVNGIFDKHPKEKDAKLIKVIDANLLPRIKKTSPSLPDVTGGIHAKLKLAFEISKLGIETLIVNGNAKDRLKNALTGKPMICTRVRP